jgi:hypothetical protein
VAQARNDLRPVKGWRFSLDMILLEDEQRKT